MGIQVNACIPYFSINTFIENIMQRWDIMQGSFEKTVLEPDFPFRLFLNKVTESTPHHWHEDIEIIYLVEGRVKVGIRQ